MFPLLALALVHFAPGSTEPLRSPQLAADAGIVALAYGQDEAIYVATSTDGGEHFGKPVKVADTSGMALVRNRGPRVVITQGAIVVNAITGAETSVGDLQSWRSTDGGKTWSKAVTVTDVPGVAPEALHALAADSKGTLFAAWLDLRTKTNQLFGASSSSDGAVDVMWRNWLDGSRDLYLICSTDLRHFGKAEKLGKGTWMLNACPMDGGGIAMSGARTVTAWRREKDIFLAEPGKAETRIGTGADVALALSGGALAAWQQDDGVSVSRIP